MSQHFFWQMSLRGTWRQLNDLNKQGQTIVLVTHEHDIAEHAKRQIHLKDGFVERDFMNEMVGSAV